MFANEPDSQGLFSTGREFRLTPIIRKISYSYWYHCGTKQRQRLNTSIQCKVKSCMIHFYPLPGRRLEPLLSSGRRLTASRLRHFHVECMRCLGLRAICSETLVARSHSNQNACMGAPFEVRNNADVVPPTPIVIASSLLWKSPAACFCFSSMTRLRPFTPIGWLFYGRQVHQFPTYGVGRASIQLIQKPLPERRDWYFVNIKYTRNCVVASSCEISKLRCAGFVFQ